MSLKDSCVAAVVLVAFATALLAPLSPDGSMARAILISNGGVLNCSATASSVTGGGTNTAPPVTFGPAPGTYTNHAFSSSGGWSSDVNVSWGQSATQFAFTMSESITRAGSGSAEGTGAASMSFNVDQPTSVRGVCSSTNDRADLTMLIKDSSNQIVMVFHSAAGGTDSTTTLPAGLYTWTTNMGQFFPGGLDFTMSATATLTVVPEPGTALVFFACGAIALGLRRHQSARGSASGSQRTTL